MKTVRSIEYAYSSLVVLSTMHTIVREYKLAQSISKTSSIYWGMALPLIEMRLISY